MVSGATIVALPKDSHERRPAMQRLKASAIRLLPMFKVVSIDSAEYAARFKQWLLEDGQSDRLKG